MALEAGAAERPVVASDAGGVAEVVRDGVSGLLVRPPTRPRWPRRSPAWRPIPEEARPDGPRRRRDRRRAMHAPERVIDSLHLLYDGLARAQS